MHERLERGNTSFLFGPHLNFAQSQTSLELIIDEPIPCAISSELLKELKGSLRPAVLGLHAGENDLHRYGDGQVLSSTVRCPGKRDFTLRFFALALREQHTCQRGVCK